MINPFCDLDLFFVNFTYPALGGSDSVDFFSELVLLDPLEPDGGVVDEFMSELVSKLEALLNPLRW